VSAADTDRVLDEQGKLQLGYRYTVSVLADDGSPKRPLPV
jgi:hypothetical protein